MNDASSPKLKVEEKLDAISRFAGVVAHDFNNIIGVILGYSDMMLKRMDLEDPLLRKITAIHKAAKQASLITKQLLFLGGRQCLNPEPIELVGFLNEVLSSLRDAIPSNVTIRMISTDGPCRLYADETNLRTTLVAILTNAWEAMPHGGNIVIQIKPDEGSAWQVSIQDEGEGISQENRPHLFEPYFTTKQPSKGRGLSLSKAYIFLRQSKGEIQIDSEPGKGTRVVLTLSQGEPLSHPWQFGDEAESRKEPETPRKPTILVIEDEEAFRRLACDVLDNLGYQTLEAPNGESALEICARRAKEIDLIFADVVLPGISGVQTAKTLRERHIQIPILFTSQYSAHLKQGDEIFQPELNFIAKPYDLSTLAQKIRKVLESGTRSR